ncbi:MAG: hypothetical protein AB2788_13770 [Candidatus Thiodiazotropha endolucinida]
MLENIMYLFFMINKYFSLRKSRLTCNAKHLLPLIFCFLSGGVNAIEFDFPTDDFLVDASQCGDGEIIETCEDTGKDQYYDNEYDGYSVITLFTNAQSPQRVKLTTNVGYYSTGIYKWRTFIPRIQPRDAISIGMFIISNEVYGENQPELDFECGYGSKNDRESISEITASDAICHLVSHDDPKPNPKVVKISSQSWHTFKLVVSGDYYAAWYIDDIEMHQVPISYSNEISFIPMISLEHLPFMGKEYPPLTGGLAHFDFFSYTNDSLKSPPSPPHLYTLY